MAYQILKKTGLSEDLIRVVLSYNCERNAKMDVMVSHSINKIELKVVTDVIGWKNKMIESEKTLPIILDNKTMQELHKFYANLSNVFYKENGGEIAEKRKNLIKKMIKDKYWEYDKRQTRKMERYIVKEQEEYFKNFRRTMGYKKLSSVEEFVYESIFDFEWEDDSEEE